MPQAAHVLTVCLVHCTQDTPGWEAVHDNMEPIIEHIQDCQLKCLENEQVCHQSHSRRTPPPVAHCCSIKCHCNSAIRLHQCVAVLAVCFTVLTLSWQYTHPVTGCAAAGADAQGARPPC